MTEYIFLAVCGQHMRGGRLHYQLEELGARYVKTTTTSHDYKLYKLDTTPVKPGLMRVAKGGAKIEVEIYSLTPESFGQFINVTPSPLGFAKIKLADGSFVTGFIVEPYAVFNSDGNIRQGVADITKEGTFRNYLD